MKITNLLRRAAMCCLLGATTVGSLMARADLVRPVPDGWASCVENANYISWSSVSGARDYAIYRSTSSTFSWGNKIATTTSTYYYDYTANNGTTYYYWVASGDATSWYVNSSSWIRITTKHHYDLTPPQPWVSVGTTSVTIYWSSVSGATSYRVYRSTSSTWSWNNTLMTTTTGTSWTDYSGVPNTRYYYWVCPVDECGTAYNTSTKYVSVVYPPVCSDLTPPQPTASVGTTSVTIYWSSVSGATAGYRVYRSTSSTWSWNNTLMTTTTGTSWTDYSGVPGTRYYYWVCPGNACSWYNTSTKYVSVVYPPIPPVPPTPTTSYNGYKAYVKVTWPSVANSHGYVVYRATSPYWSNSTRLVTTYNTYYYDHAATPGITYYYWIGVADSSGSIWYTSSKYGKGLRALTPPQPYCSISYSNYILSTWSSVVGAEFYIVYRDTHLPFNWNSTPRKVMTGNLFYYDFSVQYGVTYYYWIGVQNPSSTYSAKYIYVDPNLYDWGRLAW